VERGETIGIKSVNILPIPLDIFILNVVGAMEIDGLAVYAGGDCQTDSALPYRIARRCSVEFPSITFDLQPLSPPRNGQIGVYCSPQICLTLKPRLALHS
jgi:hypothetical protein